MFSCLDEKVPGCDLEMLAADMDAMVLWLCRQLHATGNAMSFEQQGVQGLGRVQWGGVERDGVLAAGLSLPDFRHLLRDLEATMLPRLVFVPEATSLPASLRGAHGPRAITALVGLEDVVEQQGDRLQLRLPGTVPVAQPAPPPVPASPAGPAIARLYDNEGEHELSLASYRSLVAQRTAFELFLDQTTPGARRQFKAGVKDTTGQFRDVLLSPREMAVLVLLVAAGRPLELREFKSVNTGAVDRLVERARSKIEGDRGRAGWRFFKTIPGVEAGTQRYAFQPPSDARFAAVVSLGA